MVFVRDAGVKSIFKYFFKFFSQMPLICEQCQNEMEFVKQKYCCRKCGYLKPCCEGEIMNG